MFRHKFGILHRVLLSTCFFVVDAKKRYEEEVFEWMENEEQGQVWVSHLKMGKVRTVETAGAKRASTPRLIP